MPRQIVIASSNKGKLRELAVLLEPLGLEVLPQSRFGIAPADETGRTFIENAVLKARHAARLAGLPALADDSGLVVDALDGAPGVRSARYAGESATDAENIDHLLAALRGMPMSARGAAFHCAAVFVRDALDKTPLVAEGRWPGRILERRQGNGGFGYDPVFFDPEAGKSAAEMSATEKNGRSHRGRALHALRNALAGTTRP